MSGGRGNCWCPWGEQASKWQIVNWCCFTLVPSPGRAGTWTWICRFQFFITMVLQFDSFAHKTIRPILKHLIRNVNLNLRLLVMPVYWKCKWDNQNSNQIKRALYCYILLYEYSWMYVVWKSSHFPLSFLSLSMPVILWKKFYKAYSRITKGFTVHPLSSPLGHISPVPSIVAIKKGLKSELPD